MASLLVGDLDNPNLDGDFKTLLTLRKKRLEERERERDESLRKDQQIKALREIQVTDIDNDVITEVEAAQVLPDMECLPLTKSKQDNKNIKLTTTLYKAVESGKTEAIRKVCRQIAEEGSSLADEEFKHPETQANAIHYALKINKRAAAKVLLEEGNPDFLLQEQEEHVANVTTRITVLHRLTQRGELNMIKTLLDKLPSTTGDEDDQVLNKMVLVDIDGHPPRHLAPMHIAAYNGHSHIIEYLALIGVNINLTNDRGDTPLHWAARGNRVDTVRRLVRLGAEVDHQNDKGSTALYWACRYGRTEVALTLVNEGHADVSLQRKHGLVSPIVLASALGYNDIIAVLVGNGADVNMAIQGGFTSLHYAALQGNVHAVKLLVDIGANVFAETDFGDTPLLLAAQANESECVETLITEGANVDDVNKEGKTIWNHAVEVDGSELLETLMKIFRAKKHLSATGKIIFPVGKTPLHIAAMKEEIEKLQRLLDLGADSLALDDKGNTYLHNAARNNCVAVLGVFSNQTNVNAQNSDGDTALHLACKHGKVESVNQLLKKVMIDLKNNNDETALHVACQADKADAEVVKVIVETIIKAHNWSLIDAVDKQGNTALHKAVQNGKTEILDHLKPLNARIPNKDGDTVLHIAVTNSNTELLEVLMKVFDREIDINHQNEKGKSALHIAVDKLDVELVEIILAGGADLEIKDNGGNTPLHLLARNVTPHSDTSGKYVAILEAIIDRSVKWFCERKSLEVPEPKTNSFVKYQRHSLTYLTSVVLNKSGLSVLHVCAKLGARNMLETILQIPGVYFFYHGDQYVFDVTSLTPETILFPNDEAIKHKSIAKLYKHMYTGVHDESNIQISLSCLDIIIRSNDSVIASGILNVVPIKHLVQDYWTLYQGMFGFLLVLHIIYMSFFSAYGVPLNESLVPPIETPENNATFTSSTKSFPNGLFLIWPIILVLFEMYYLLINLYIWKVKPKSSQPISKVPKSAFYHFKQLLNFLLDRFSHICCALFCVFIFTWFILYCYNDNYQVTVQACCLISGWLFSIVFINGFQTIHAYSAIIKNIIVRDVSRFALIYLFILFAFSFAFQACFWLSPSLSSLHPSTLHVFFLVFNMMMGINEIFSDSFDEEFHGLGLSHVATFIRFLYVLYILISAIILLNLLIAMMTDSYSEVKEREDTGWKIGSLRLAMHIEKSMPFIPRICKIFGMKRNALSFDKSTSRWLLYVPQSEVQFSTSRGDDEMMTHIQFMKKEIKFLRHGLSTISQTLEQLIHLSGMPDLDPTPFPNSRPVTTRPRDLMPRTSTPKIPIRVSTDH